MHLVEILLPLKDNDGNRFPEAVYDEVRKDLAEHFGGVTAFTRSPAKGLWENNGELVPDDVVVFEVMVDHLEREFWRLYKHELEETFAQDAVPIRAHRIELL